MRIRVVRDRLRQIRHLLAETVGETVGLIVPVECCGCGAWDVELCPECRRLLSGEPWRCEQVAPYLGQDAASTRPPSWAVAAYSGAVRPIVLAWKNARRREVTEAVLEAGRRAGRTVGAQLAAACVGEGLVEGWRMGDSTLAVVPAPSGWRRRRRGLFVVGDLAEAVAAGVAESGGPWHRVVVIDLLRRGSWSHRVLRWKGAWTQSADRLRRPFGERRRSRHRHRSAGGGPVRALVAIDGPVLLVDDVLTTGATLAASMRAIRSAGGQVCGALVVACTPSPRRGR